MRLIKELDHFVETSLKNMFFAGRLATDDELASTMIEAPVFVGEDNEVVHFHIKCLSEIPSQILESVMYPNGIFGGSTLSHVNVSKLTAKNKGFTRLLAVDKKNFITKLMENKLIIFKLVMRQNNLYLEIEKVEEQIPAEQYIAIPMPTNVSMANGQRDFEHRLNAGLPIQFNQYPNFFSKPEFIYYGRKLYCNVTLRNTDIPTTYYATFPEKMMSLILPLEFFDWADSRIDHLVFLNANFITEIYRQMDDDGDGLLTDGDEISESELPVESIQTPVQVVPESVVSDNAERVFLEMLEQNAKQKGLYYDQHDLINFHVSLKTNALTIVGGMSGTGKSQLARLYGESMGLVLNDTMLLIPVSPAYHEPNDLLGFYNPLTNQYYENETGLVTLLQKAQNNPDQLYMVIFDEMNLAQVEHWFAPFISLLELENGQRILNLFPSDGQKSENGYSARVNLGNNLMFVGTVNFDETTKSFSNRLLDRSNLISPKKLSFSEVRALGSSRDTGTKFQTMRVTSSQFRSIWIQEVNQLAVYTDDEIQILDEIHRLMHEADHQKGVSFRAIKSMAAYIANIPTMTDGQYYMNRQEAFDLQLKQRVLTKISGPTSAIGELVGKYRVGHWEHGEIASLLHNSASNQGGTFQHSLAYLLEKAKELYVHGYAN